MNSFLIGLYLLSRGSHACLETAHEDLWFKGKLLFPEDIIPLSPKVIHGSIEHGKPSC